MAIYHSLRLVSLRYADLQLVRHGFELNNVSIRRLDSESGRFIVRVGRTESSKEVAHSEFAYANCHSPPFSQLFTAGSFVKSGSESLNAPLESIGEGVLRKNSVQVRSLTDPRDKLFALPLYIESDGRRHSCRIRAGLWR